MSAVSPLHTDPLYKIALQTPGWIYSKICEKITQIAETVFGYIMNIITFQMGVLNQTGAAWIIRAFQIINSDPREQKAFDPIRLQKSKDFLAQYGGTEVILEPADKTAKIRAMTFKSKDFFEILIKKGAIEARAPVGLHYRRVLLNPPLEDAAKFSLEVADVRIDGVEQKAIILPHRCDSSNPPHIIHAHSPGRSMCMDRKVIGLHLAAGYDITVWDPRGVAESTGVPTEAGEYLDAEAVFEHVLSLGRPHNQIYVSGYCKGASIVAHLKEKYHHLGTHFIGSNFYTSLKDVFLRYGFFGYLTANYGMKAIQEPHAKVRQDGYNVLAKFRNLKDQYSTGKFILIHTDTDNMMPRNTVKKTRKTLGFAGNIHEILRKHPDPKANGHMQPPYEDPAVWERYVEVVT